MSLVGYTRQRKAGLTNLEERKDTHHCSWPRVRATMLGNEVLSFEQRNTSVVTDFSHGLGEIITSTIDEAPTDVGKALGGLGFSETIFTLTQELPYNFGAVTQLLNETDDENSDDEEEDEEDEEDKEDGDSDDEEEDDDE